MKCKRCGCTWNNACLGGCYWVDVDLCSECATQEEMETYRETTDKVIVDFMENMKRIRSVTDKEIDVLQKFRS